MPCCLLALAAGTIISPMRRIIFPLVGLCLLLQGWHSGGVQGPVRVETMLATQEYGLALHFLLLGSSEIEVERAALFAAAPGFDFTYTTTFEVQNTILDLHYTLSLQNIRPAPFATVRYWWELHLVNGEQIILETQTLPYVDNRYTWQSAAADPIIVYWQGEEMIGDIALEIAQQTRQQLQNLLPAQLPEPLPIYIYPSASDLRSALRLGGQDWQDGHADPALGVLLVVAVNPRTAREDLAQMIPQEMSRLVLYLAAQAEYEQLPRWLVEGLAGAVMEEQVAQTTLLRNAAAQQTLIPLSDLCTTWPDDDAQLQLAMAQSRDLTRWLVSEFGVLTLNQLLRVYQTGESCQDGLVTATNLSFVTLEQQWQNHWRPQPEFIRIIQESGLWFLLILAGFLLTALLLLSHWQR